MRVDLNAGEKAFEGCPSCGEPLEEYTPGSDDEYESWYFRCGCDLFLNDDDMVEPYLNCPDAMNMILQQIVWTTKDR